MNSSATRISTLILGSMLLSASPTQVRAVELEDQILRVGQYALPAKVPRGLKLEVLNVQMQRPRMLAFAPDGALWAGSGQAVFRLEKPYREATVITTRSDYPHAVAFRGDEVFLATNTALLKASHQTTPISDWQHVIDIPGGGGHSSRTVRVGPDGRVYVALGISGNCSDEYLGASYPTNKRRGGVMVLDESTSPPHWSTHASGLRNPVGFDWHPVSKVIYASNNGPDHSGFEVPREAFARLTSDSFHGMPWFQWLDGKVVRDECATSSPPRPANEVTAPAATLPARSAPMAVAFAGPSDLGGRFSGSAVIAVHGSWATAPSGGGSGDPASRRPPRLALVVFENDQAVRVETLVTGFQLEEGGRWARPVGAAFGPDGALYFSSDGGINGLFRLTLGN
jgi:glucose/arabinose dehydrogenase